MKDGHAEKNLNVIKKSNSNDCIMYEINARINAQRVWISMPIGKPAGLHIGPQMELLETFPMRYSVADITSILEHRNNIKII